MDGGQIAAIVVVSAFAVAIAVGIPLLQRRAKRLYISRFTAIGARNIVTDATGVHCELERDGRAWKLAMISPLAMKRSASLTRDDVPRLVARVELARQAPFDLQVVPVSDEPVARREYARLERSALNNELEVRAPTGDALAALTPDVIAAIQRAYEVLIVDLELRLTAGSRTLECTKLYGARDLPAFVAAVEAIAVGLERVL